MTELTLSTRLRMQVAMGTTNKFTPELILETVALLERAQRVEDMLVEVRNQLQTFINTGLLDLGEDRNAVAAAEIIPQIDEVLK